MSVAPGNFTLIFNTVIGEASRQLAVTGTLVDGTSLDITAGPYGTTYSSSDLTIVSFGAEPGRVFAGQSGVATVTAHSGARQAVAVVHVQTFAPTVLASLSLPGYANAVVVDGDYAFVAAGNAGLLIVDVSSPNTPHLIKTLPLPGAAFDVVASGGLAFVAAGSGGLQVVDVGDPAAPVVIGAAATPAAALDLAVDGTRVYVADGLGLEVFDATDPALPARLGSVATPGRARGVDVSGDLAVVADEIEGVEVIDVRDPAAPSIVGATPTRADGTSNAADVVVRERLAYVSDGARNLGV